MGFVHVRYDGDGQPVAGWPKVTVRLEHLEPSGEGPFAKVTWRMLDDLGYELPDSVPDRPGRDRFVVARRHGDGDATDLASVPPWLWGVIASYGRHTLAALLHDDLCEQARAAGPPSSARMRREADHLFRVAMADLEVPAIRRWVMWAAVRLFGEKDQPGMAAKGPAIVVVLAVLATWAWVVTALLGGPDLASLAAGGGVLATVASAVTAIGGRRDLAGGVLVGTVAGVVIAPALVVSLLTVVLLDAPSLVGWFARKAVAAIPGIRVPDPGPPPKVGPMASP